VRAGVLGLEAWLVALDGDQQLALARENQSLDLARAIGDQQILSFVVVRAVWNALGRDDRPAAARHIATALSIARETGDQFVLVNGLEGVAERVASADPRPSARLMGASAPDGCESMRWRCCSRVGRRSQRDVAVALTISEGTARIHTQRILGQLGLRSRAQVTDWARTRGLLPDD
jgi:hypothetical protein